MILALAALATPALARPAAAPTEASPIRTVSAQIEAKAAREAVMQAERDARFDAQVRRVTGSICANCLMPNAPPRRR